jgi:hypothetical protein
MMPFVKLPLLLSQPVKLLSHPSAERQMFLDMCHDPDIIQKLAASIAPKIKGADDIKMAIACLLFGGSRKVSTLEPSLDCARTLNSFCWYPVQLSNTHDCAEGTHRVVRTGRGSSSIGSVVACAEVTGWV